MHAAGIINTGINTGIISCISFVIFYTYYTYMQHQGEAAGISGKAFPYSQVMKGDSPYSIKGLPGELPLRHPKNYGSKQLKEIIKFKEDFKVVFNIYFNLFILKLFMKAFHYYLL